MSNPSIPSTPFRDPGVQKALQDEWVREARELSFFIEGCLYDNELGRQAIVLLRTLLMEVIR